MLALLESGWGLGIGVQGITQEWVSSAGSQDATHRSVLGVQEHSGDGSGVLGLGELKLCGDSVLLFLVSVTL